LRPRVLFFQSVFHKSPKAAFFNLDGKPYLRLTAITSYGFAFVPAVFAAESCAVYYPDTERGAPCAVFRAVAAMQPFRLEIAPVDFRGIVGYPYLRAIKIGVAFAIPPVDMYRFSTAGTNPHGVTFLFGFFFLLINRHLFSS
jgi:hypothetical protein